VDTKRMTESEPLLRQALAIAQASHGPDHPNVGICLDNLAELLRTTNRLTEAEPLYRRSLAIDEASYGPDHSNVAVSLNNLALLLHATNRLTEAEPLCRRALEILIRFNCTTGHEHPRYRMFINNYTGLLAAMGQTPEQIHARLDEIGRPFGVSFSGEGLPGNESRPGGSHLGELGQFVRKPFGR
jgi:tetratricopeptide (TPR) repeat protein